MKVTKLHLKNFKRFTDLKIENIPTSAKLVLLIGSNGSGKSSVFDAFEVSSQIFKGASSDRDYYKKNKNNKFSVEIFENERSSILNEDFDFGVNGSSSFNAKSFYGRTSFRQVPKLKRTALGQGGKFNFEEDSDRPRQFIEKDDRFENDIEKITEVILKDLFRSENTKEQIKEKYIFPINSALDNIFGGGNGTRLKLIEIIPPLEGKVAQINFLKGNSEIHYNLLSAGEKEIFNILINLLSRRHIFNDTVYFLDEIDLHLNTKLQFNLIKEITENWIPDSCQFWTASHALGFIDYARQSDMAAIIDFDDLDFDKSQVLTPLAKDSLQVYDVAVPVEMLAKMFAGKRIVICENRNDEYYNLLDIDNTVFVGVKDSRSVFISIKRDDYYALRDRDFLSDAEIIKIKKKFSKYRILNYYAFENYLYHPDNVAELKPAGFSTEDYISDITAQKNQRYDSILADIKLARQNYEEFKTDEQLRDKDINEIVADLKSNEFERFYKYFSMKDEYHKIYLEAYNLSKSSLCKTKWFKNAIQTLLK